MTPQTFARGRTHRRAGAARAPPVLSPRLRGFRWRTTRFVIRSPLAAATVVLPHRRSDMPRTEPRTFLASPAVMRGGAHDEQPSCLACGARICSGEPTIEIRGALSPALRDPSAAGGATMTSQRRDPNCRSRLNGQEPRVRARPITVMAAQGVDRVGAQERHAAAVLRLSGSGMKRLDPEVVASHLAHLLRAAWAMCGSRESAEDLVQETVARVLSRPRLLRGEDERAYLMQALRNTFVSSGGRPRAARTSPRRLRSSTGPTAARRRAQRKR